MKNTATLIRLAVLILLCAALPAFAQLTPSDDAYTNTASPTLNFGGKPVLDVQSVSQNSYIRFDLSPIPAGYTGANIGKATLKLYVNTVTTAGSFNVDFVNGTWTEGTITSNLAPALGTTVAAVVPVTTANRSDYLIVDVTSAVQAWLNGTQANDGLALVANSPLNATFDSKESTTQSHPPELDIVFAGGTITGVSTAPSSGLTGGGTSGALNLSLTTSCSTNQVLQWNGGAWNCANPGGTGTVTSVGLSAPASDFTVSGSPVTGSGTLGLNWIVPPDVSATANSIVKRDSGGGINAISASISGLSAVYTNVGGNNYVFPSVYGSNSYGTGTGVWGQVGTQSSTSSAFGHPGVGVWGDGGTSTSGAPVGVQGTVDYGNGGVFANNSTAAESLYAYNFNRDGNSFFAGNPRGSCYIDLANDLNCSGSKNAVVPIEGGKRTVAMSAIEAPQNWFEDFGEASLSNGAAVVQLDSTYTQTVNSDTKYQVFLTPYGDCKGLYVTNRTANSFEVRELGGGKANLSFGYRIAVLRKNFENVRFADHTHDLDGHKALIERLKNSAAQPAPQEESAPGAMLPRASVSALGTTRMRLDQK